MIHTDYLKRKSYVKILKKYEEYSICLLYTSDAADE